MYVTSLDLVALRMTSKHCSKAALSAILLVRFRSRARRGGRSPLLCVARELARFWVCATRSGWRDPHGDVLRGDEGDELADALLHGLLGVLGHLGVARERLLHNTTQA